MPFATAGFPGFRSHLAKPPLRSCGHFVRPPRYVPEYIADPSFTIYELLDSYNVSASIYSDGWTAVATFKGPLRRQDHYFGTIDDFYSDCEKGDLPNYCFVEPRYRG